MQGLKCFDYRTTPSALDRLNHYDAAIYHLGNDHRYHAGIYEVLRNHPGIAVFHEYTFQDFFVGQANDLKDWRFYLEEIDFCYGADERAKAEESIERGDLPPQARAPLDYPLNCRLARSAEGIIAHSEWTRSRLSKVAPNVPTARVSMGKGTSLFATRSFRAIGPRRWLQRRLLLYRNEATRSRARTWN